MKRTLEGMIDTGEPLIQEAVVALRRYHEALEAGAASGEVERLRVIAESAYQAVTDYQLYALGHQPIIRH